MDEIFRFLRVSIDCLFFNARMNGSCFT